MAEVPAHLLDTVRLKIARIEGRNYEAGRDVQGYFVQVLPDFTRELEDYFLHRLVLTSTDPQDPYLDGDGLARIVEKFEDIVDAIERNLDEELTETLVDEHDDAYWLAFWELQTWGVDTSTLPRPDHDHTLEALLAGGILGLNYRDRLYRWGAIHVQKFREWVTSSARVGRTYDDTMTGVRRVMTGWQDRVEALAGDERHRAHVEGTRAAWATVPDVVVGELWITRDDPRVCPLCRSKHLTITTDQPIRDTHPACRCMKMPIIAGSNGIPINYGAAYDAFVRSMATR